MSTLKTTFSLAFNSIEKKIPFDVEWKNGTGYLNGACDVELEVGEQATSIDDFGRRVFLVGTPVGTAVAFERYTPSEPNDVFVVVSNVPGELSDIIPSGSMDTDTFYRYFRSDRKNIGTIVANIIEAASA